MAMPRIPLVYVTEEEYHHIKKVGVVNDYYNLGREEHVNMLAPGRRCAFVYDNQCRPLVVAITATNRAPERDTCPYDLMQYIAGEVS